MHVHHPCDRSASLSAAHCDVSATVRLRVCALWFRAFPTPSTSKREHIQADSPESQRVASAPPHPKARVATWKRPYPSDGFATGCMRMGSLRVACARATPDATSTSEHEHIQHGIEADPQNRGEPRALPPLSDEPQAQHSESSTTSKTSSANSSTNATGAGLATFSNGPSFGANA